MRNNISTRIFGTRLSLGLSLSPGADADIAPLPQGPGGKVSAPHPAEGRSAFFSDAPPAGQGRCYGLPLGSEVCIGVWTDAGRFVDALEDVELAPVEYEVVVTPGYTLLALSINPDGTYSAMVAREGAWAGTTVSGVRIGEGVEGLIVE